MKHSKKKGSVLITVVAMFAMLSILTISMIGGVMTSYDLTKNSNERIEKFYSADSGLEIAYNKIIDVVGNAISIGNEEVEIIKNKKTNTSVDAEGNLVNTEKEGWQNDVFKGYYRKYLKDNLEIAIDNVQHNSIIYDDFDRNQQIIKVDAVLKDSILKEKGEIIPVYLNSTFTGEDLKKRVVEVDYDIRVPDYGTNSMTEEVQGNINIFDYIFATDGNLDIELNTSFNVLGDMWVKGGELRNSRDPLSRGVFINEKNINSKIEWHGDIATGGTLDLNNIGIDTPRDNNKNYNIYANDFRYIGNPKNTRYLFSSKVLEDENKQNNYGVNLHLYNDFIFNGTNTQANMKSFYGLNDITSNGNDTTEPKTASSMIIESEDLGKKEDSKFSQINIASETMILGTAYLNLTANPLNNINFFKTGESIVVNRQSSPYTYRNYTEDDYLYKYKGELHMVDKMYIGGEYKDLTITDKVGLVQDFYNEELKNSTKESEMINLAKGINLNESKVFTTGIAYDNGNIIKGSNEEILNTAIAKKKEFAREVYLMGSENVTEDDFANKEFQSTVEGNFNWDVMRKIVEGEDILDTDNTILFRKENNDHNLKNGAAVFTGVSDKLKVNNILPNEYIDGLHQAKINIVFNYSDNDLVLRFNQPVLEEEKVKNKIYVDLETIDVAGVSKMNPTIIISKGDVILEREKTSYDVNASMDFTSLIYTAGNMVFDIDDGPCNVGNYMSGDTKLNRVFKEFFTNGKLGDSLLGDIIGGTKSESFEKISNPEDLIEKSNWRLNK